MEHPKANQFVAFLHDDPSPQVLRERMGPPIQDDLIEVLVEDQILIDQASAPAPIREPAVRFTRSGILFPGIATPSRWLDRRLVPVLLSWPGRLALLSIVGAGVVSLLNGRPDAPAVSSTPALEALLMLTIGLSLTVAHELAHGVALVHFGRTPTRAGFGFYWGALSFYVDSTPGLTLGRTQRVIQALSGLAVDVVTVSLCAVLAAVCDSTILTIVLWRLAVLGAFDLVVNLAPILEVDGHWALADLLDEPDLSPRSRRALGQPIHGLRPTEPWLAWYGAFSLLTGLGLLAAMVLIFWETTGALVTALFAGNAGEIALGLYYVVPLALGLVFSILGLLIETLAKPTAERPAA